EQELPEDLRDVAAVDLVDNQDVRTRRIGRCVPSDLSQRTVSAVVAHPVRTIIFDGSKAANEVLVAVGGVELNDPERTAVAGDLVRERQGDERLARPRWSVKHDLALLLEQLKRILKPVAREKHARLDFRAQDRHPKSRDERTQDGVLFGGHTEVRGLGEADDLEVLEDGMLTQHAAAQDW